MTVGELVTGDGRWRRHALSGLSDEKAEIAAVVCAMWEKVLRNLGIWDAEVYEGHVALSPAIKGKLWWDINIISDDGHTCEQHTILRTGTEGGLLSKRRRYRVIVVPLPDNANANRV